MYRSPSTTRSATSSQPSAMVMRIWRPTFTTGCSLKADMAALPHVRARAVCRGGGLQEAVVWKWGSLTYAALSGRAFTLSAQRGRDFATLMGASLRCWCAANAWAVFAKEARP